MELYNETVKREFLNQYEDETSSVYERVFKHSKGKEKSLSKDLYNFNEQEYEEFIKSLKPKTKESVRTYCNVLSTYVQYGIDKGLSYHITNPIKRRQEYFYNFVEEKQLYFSYEEKESILMSLENEQDQFIIEALFNGIEGKQVSELVNLKISDLSEKDGKYYFKLTNIDGSQRILEVSRKTYNLAKYANSQQQYYKKNGQIGEHERISAISELDNSDYIIKKANTNLNGESKGNPYLIYNRLDSIKSLDEFKEYKDVLSTKNIVRSGMLYYAKLLYERDGQFTTKQVKEVCERFNVNYRWSMKDFLNLDKIVEFYYNNEESLIDVQEKVL